MVAGVFNERIFMSFDSKGFSPVHVNAGPLSPRVFSYLNPNDVLSEIMKPGYFNAQKMIMRPNSFVKVICGDAVVELVVKTNVGNVTMRDEFLRATDPYKEMFKSTRKKRRTQDEMQADKEKVAPTAKAG